MPGESHGQRGLAGYIPWGPKELDAIQRLTHTHSHTFIRVLPDSLIAQLVKSTSAMQETPVLFLGWEEPLEKDMATHSSVLGLPLWLSW